MGAFEAEKRLGHAGFALGAAAAFFIFTTGLFLIMSYVRHSGITYLQVIEIVFLMALLGYILKRWLH